MISWSSHGAQTGINRVYFRQAALTGMHGSRGFKQLPRLD